MRRATPGALLLSTAGLLVTAIIVTGCSGSTDPSAPTTTTTTNPSSASLEADPLPEVDLAPAATFGVDRAMSLAVPSLCGHPAGTLVEGALPGIDPLDGQVWLGESPLFASGDLTGDGVDEVLVALSCTAGGNMVTNVVAVYDTAGVYLTLLDLADLSDEWFSQYPVLIDIAEEVAHVTFAGGYGDDDSRAAGRIDGTFDLRLESGRAVTENLTVLDDVAAAQGALDAARRGDRAALLAVMTPTTADTLLAEVSLLGAAPTVDLCEVPDSAEMRSICLIGPGDGDDYMGDLELVQVGVGAWKIESFLNYTTS